jgi:hypothetical protein
MAILFIKFIYEMSKHASNITFYTQYSYIVDVLSETVFSIQKFGKSVESTDRRMTRERCGQLCAVAIANKLDEAWMALPPIVFFVHFLICYPNAGSL